ncbi:MAG: hypothetical protein ABJG88_04515 [Litorimonas sp.]
MGHTQSDTTALDDLEYIKTLAQEGASTPLLGGRIGLMWGVLLSLTFFIQWGILSNTFDLPIQNLAYLWLAYSFIGVIGSIILGRKIDKKAGVNSVSNRVDNHIWILFSGMMATLFVGIMLNISFNDATVQLFDLMVVVGFAGQGMAYGLTAKMSHIKWMHIAAFACFTMSAICFSAYGSFHIYLIGAIGACITVIIPSVITIRNEPKDVI